MMRLRELRFVIKESLPFYFEAHGDISDSRACI